ncbi:MAG TPA: hypothetical protein VNO14_14195 [Blastocatellia bacterium]|nr:hypothetical protein [Blastocatellia bacterium]
MSTTQGKFPDTLVLAFTTLYQPCTGNVATQIQQGNTFSVPFDMTKAPHAPGQNGLVFLKTDPESNFQAAAPLQLSNEGLSDKIGFMSVGSVKATVFGQPETVTRLFLVGTPKGDVFTWQAGIFVGNCIVTNGEVAEEVLAKAKQAG